MQDIAKHNLALAESRASVARRLLATRRDQQLRDEQATKAEAAFDAAQRRFAAAGLTEAVGVELRGLRAQLPDMESLRRSLRDRLQQAASPQQYRVVLWVEGLHDARRHIGR